jgi:ABC-type uncharacterized transport system ATPase subunit
MATLRTVELTKSYAGRTVVRDVSLEVASGEVVGLLGPNGAGKTTTFYMTVGLAAPDSGRVLLDDGYQRPDVRAGAEGVGTRRSRSSGVDRAEHPGHPGNLDLSCRAPVPDLRERGGLNLTPRQRPPTPCRGGAAAVGLRGRWCSPSFIAR